MLQQHGWGGQALPAGIAAVAEARNGATRIGAANFLHCLRSAARSERNTVAGPRIGIGRAPETGRRFTEALRSWA